MRQDGFVAIGDLCAVLHRMRIPGDLPLILDVVRNNQKSRFQILLRSGVPAMVRATGGHSLACVRDHLVLDQALTRPYRTLIHGSFVRFMESIVERGLLPGG